LSEVSPKRVLVADADEIVAFITSQILSRYDYAVETVNSADALAARGDGFDCVVVSDAIARETARLLNPQRVVILGDRVDGFNAFARLRKPVELDLLAMTVGACANR